MRKAGVWKLCEFQARFDLIKLSSYLLADRMERMKQTFDLRELEFRVGSTKVTSQRAILWRQWHVVLWRFKELISRRNHCNQVTITSTSITSVNSSTLKQTR